MQEIYFDNAATTQVLPEVADLALHMMREEYGNPSALYQKGLRAERCVKQAREQIAAQIGAKPQEIIFTSGGTESNNMAVRGVMHNRAKRGRHLIISSVEHQSVMQTARALLEEDFDFDLLPVNSQGVINLAAVPKMIRPDTVLVSVMLVNNEVGALQPIAELRQAMNSVRANLLLHVDAVQGFGKMPIDVHQLGIDFLSVSGHKLHAPKGTGFLYVRQGLRVPPLLTGGGQEGGWRSGTENVPGICALGLAAQLAGEQMQARREQIEKVRQTFLQALQNLDGWEINGPTAEAAYLPNILNIYFAGVKSEILLHLLETEGLLVAAGSACANNHKDSLSHVLRAMQLRRAQIEGSLRFSFSHLNTTEEAERAAQIICQQVPPLRETLHLGR